MYEKAADLCDYFWQGKYENIDKFLQFVSHQKFSFSSFLYVIPKIQMYPKICQNFHHQNVLLYQPTRH